MIYFQSLSLSDLEAMLLPFSHIKKAGDLTPDELEIKKMKRARFRAKQIYHWVYQRFVSDWDEMTDLSKDLREWLKSNVEFYRIGTEVTQQSDDGTFKVLWKLSDKKTIESVIIPSFGNEVESKRDGFSGKSTETSLDSEKWSRHTICISSQVGCTMGCKFCLTGIQGLDRHLETYEIVSQVWELRKKIKISNIVFMGMGEPLHNLDSVIKACQIFVEEDGMNFSKRKVTVSTSGIVPAIDTLGKSVDVSLAISLNATTDEIRSQIMPVNRKWNIESLMAACKRYPLGLRRKITIEYVLLEDVNDSLEDARRLVKILRGVPNKVNLIPFNEHSGADFKRPSDGRVRDFQNILINSGLTATVRISRGRDILAACGQLRSLLGTARGTERHVDYQVNSL